MTNVKSAMAASQRLSVAVRRVAAASLLMTAWSAHANFLCEGTVSYLGIGAAGEVSVSVGATPIHSICNLSAQGAYAMTTASCKAAYSALVAAKMTGKRVSVYYGLEPLTCSTPPAWGAAPTYFVQGPD